VIVKCSVSTLQGDVEGCGKPDENTKEIGPLKGEKLLLMEEILHQLICSLSHYLPGFLHPRWCRISSINSSYSWCLDPEMLKIDSSNLIQSGTSS